MKKERKFKLTMNKVSVSKLNNIKGKGDPLTESSVTFPCIISIDNYSCEDDCRTGLTVLNESVGAC